MSDVPRLTASTAAREATVENATPSPRHRHLGEGSDCAPWSFRPSYGRGVSSSSIAKNTSEHSLSQASDKAGGPTKNKSSPNLGSVLAASVEPVVNILHSPNPDHPVTEMRVGCTLKQFAIYTDLLVLRSPWFAARQDHDTCKLPDNLTFPEFDEYAFTLFKHWLYGGKLHGPHDFQSMNHYVCLYVLACEFDIEKLRNDVIDLVRRYYYRENMTAPAYRLEYMYAKTKRPNPMREFLVTSAAYRAFSETGISDSIRTVLHQGGDCAVDFADALVRLARNGRVDMRKGDECRWHEHDVTEKCSKWRGFEPYEDA